MKKAKRRRGLRFGLLAAVGVWVIALGATVTGTFSAPSKNPPGANGTVKIDGIPFDIHPDNQPHVTCTFEVDFYGFDQGAYNAEVTFVMQPPSGRRFILTDTVFVGEDPAGGGTDLDAQKEYNLDRDAVVFGSERHAQQGWHVYLTVKAPGAGGKIATKHKVFWVDECIDDP